VDFPRPLGPVGLKPTVTGVEVGKMSSPSPVQEQIDEGAKLRRALIRHAVRLAKKRKERAEALRQMMESLRPKMGELKRMKATMTTLLRARAEEFFEVYEEREKILREWREEARPILEAVSRTSREFFMEVKTVAELGEKLGIYEGEDEE